MQTTLVEPTALKEQLIVRQQKTSNEYWLQGLADRKVAELEFHNKNRDVHVNKDLPQDTYELLHGNRKYYSTVALSANYVQNWLRTEAKNKVFLDYACGNGDNALNAAAAGATLAIGLDISDVSVGNGAREADKRNLKNVVFVQGDCENTELPSNSIDTIICSGMLHHLDLSYAFPELRRILKPGGKILGVEALNYNPLIKLYRTITPSMRTEWEKNHILSLKDLTFADRFFEVRHVNYWHITSIFCAYFHKIPALQKAVLGVANFLDRILTKIPFIQLMAWQFTFELVKRDEK